MTDKFAWRSADITSEEQAKIDAFIQDKLDKSNASMDPAEFMSELGFVPLGDSTSIVEKESPCVETEGKGKCCGGRCG